MGSKHSIVRVTYGNKEILNVESVWSQNMTILSCINTWDDWDWDVHAAI